MTPPRRAALAAVLGWAGVIMAAGALDPSGLAAPLAWTGADPTGARWALLPYVLYGPLMLLLVGLAAWALLSAASPGAPRRWVWWRTWLLVVGAVMLAKLVYSAVLLAPELISGAGVPLGTTLPYLVWATGVTGVKALLLGWIPSGCAALVWRPSWAPPIGSPGALGPAGVSLSAALVVLAVAVGGTRLATLWWTGSPVGYAHSTDWRSLAPTAGSGWLGQAAALAVLGLLLVHGLSATLRRTAPPPARAPAIAGAVAALGAGLGLGVVQTLVAVVLGTDLPGSGDLWIVPSTYLRLVEGLSFGLLVAPLAASAVWAVQRLDLARRAEIGTLACVAVSLVAVTLGSVRFAGVPPLAADPQPVALPQTRSAERPGADEPPATPARLTVRRDADGSAVLADQRGAQVLLRGVNVNQLGQYYAADPDVPTVAALRTKDFADIAAMGFDAVRLVLSWSLVQPQPGTVDEEYLARVREAVDRAGAQGIHVVLDMHQDAWGASVVAPPGTACRPGTSPMTGWDGAPDWASYPDDAPPCMFTGRDLAPNVLRAFSSFYADREQIQTELVSAWGRIAETFGADPTVAGYDLLNEPSFAEQAPLTSGVLLGRYHARAIEAIRAGERRAKGGYSHPVFVEPSIWWSGFGIDPLPPRGFTTDSQIVFSPHLYNESITIDQSLGITLVGIARGFALAERAAALWGAPLWIGEWGSFADGQANSSYYARFMTQADASRSGSAIWVWKQACGDPHVYPSDEAGNIRRVACPEGTPLPTRSEELTAVTRAYPRAAPGRLVAVESGTGSVRVVGTTVGAGHVIGTPDPCSLDIWVPGSARPTWREVRGVMDLRAVRVREGSAAQDPSGGWRVLGCASGEYHLTVVAGAA